MFTEKWLRVRNEKKRTVERKACDRGAGGRPYLKRQGNYDWSVLLNSESPSRIGESLEIAGNGVQEVKRKQHTTKV